MLRPSINQLVLVLLALFVYQYPKRPIHKGCQGLLVAISEACRVRTPLPLTDQGFTFPHTAVFPH